jgi:O-antigen/teichoic acid export membrane protein
LSPAVVREHPIARVIRSAGSHGVAVAEQGAVSGLNFVSVAALGRLLDSREFALYVLLYATISLPYLVSSTFWTYPAMVLFPKQPQGTTGQYSRTVMACNGVTLVLLGSLSLVLAHGFLREFSISLGIAALLAAVGWGSYDCARRLAYAAREGSRLVGPSVMLVPVYGLTVYLTLRSGRLDARSALLCLAFSFFASSAVAAWLLRPTFGPSAVGLVGVREVVGRHWRTARWLIPSTAAYFVTSHGFFLLGARLLSDRELGGLRAAHNLLSVMSVVLLAFENHYVPRASEVLHRDGADAFYRFVGAMYARGLVLFGAVTLLTAAVAYAGFAILYGAKYPEAQNLVFAFALFQLVLTCSVPAQVAWNTQEKSYVCMWGAVAAAGIACLLGGPLIARGGALGAALGMLASASTLTAVLVVALGLTARRFLSRGAPAL